MATTKTYAVRIYDRTANTEGHDSMAVTTYENLETIQLRDCNDQYGLTEEEADELKKQYIQQISDKDLSDWASVEIDCFEYDPDEL